MDPLTMLIHVVVSVAADVVPLVDDCDGVACFRELTGNNGTNETGPDYELRGHRENLFVLL